MGTLWLIHAALVAGSPAYRYTRWVLFGGLPIVAVVMLVCEGVFGFMFALIAAWTWLGMAFSEAILILGVITLRGTAAEQAATAE